MRRAARRPSRPPPRLPSPRRVARRRETRDDPFVQTARRRNAVTSGNGARGRRLVACEAADRPGQPAAATPVEQPTASSPPPPSAQRSAAPDASSKGATTTMASMLRAKQKRQAHYKEQDDVGKAAVVDLKGHCHLPNIQSNHVVPSNRLLDESTGGSSMRWSVGRTCSDLERAGRFYSIYHVTR